MATAGGPLGNYQPGGDNSNVTRYKTGPRILYGEEFLVECPYDSSHKILNHRMLTHLMKCRRNYKSALAAIHEKMLMMTCKYNWLHQVPHKELMYHESVCPDQNHVCAYFAEVSTHPLLELDTKKRKVVKDGAVRKEYQVVLTLGADNSEFFDTKKKPTEPDDPGHSSLSREPRPAIEKDQGQNAGGNGDPVSPEEESWDLEPDDPRNFQTYDPRAKQMEETYRQVMKIPPNLTKSDKKAFMKKSRAEVYNQVCGQLGIAPYKNPLNSENAEGLAEDDRMNYFRPRPRDFYLMHEAIANPVLHDSY